MEAQTTWASREVSIEEKELNDLLGAAPISSASTPTSSVDPVVDELPAPELEPAAPFKDDQFSIKGKIPGYDPTKKMDVEITLNKNGKRSLLKLPDPIVADDGTFVVDIDIFKYGINE